MKIQEVVKGKYLSNSASIIRKFIINKLKKKKKQNKTKQKKTSSGCRKIYLPK